MTTKGWLPAPKYCRPASRRHKEWRFSVAINQNPETSRCVDLRRLSKCRIGGIANQPSVPQLKRTASVCRVGFRVSDLHDGCALLIQLPKELHDLFGLTGMQVAGGFVGKQEQRLVDA